MTASEPPSPLTKGWLRPWLFPEQVTTGAYAPETLRQSAIMCSALEDAEWFAGRAVSEILLTEFPATQHSADRIAELNRGCQLIATVDHFYHAELLSVAARQQSQQLDVAIEVDIGAHRSGIRPGYDAFRLAMAIFRLPNLRLTGLIADIGTWHLVADAGQPPVFDVAEAFSALQHTRDLINREKPCCDLISVATDHDPESLRCYPVITEVRGTTVPLNNLFFSERVFQRSTGNETGSRPVITVTSQIISRPSLHRAVAGTGLRSLAAALNDSGLRLAEIEFGKSRRASVFPRLTEMPGATVTSVGPDTLVLELSSAALDLTIGHRVQVIWA